MFAATCTAKTIVIAFKEGNFRRALKDAKAVEPQNNPVMKNKKDVKHIFSTKSCSPFYLLKIGKG
jgi:hypothetical protein